MTRRIIVFPLCGVIAAISVVLILLAISVGSVPGALDGVGLLFVTAVLSLNAQRGAHGLPPISWFNLPPQDRYLFRAILILTSLALLCFLVALVVLFRTPIPPMHR